MDSSQNTSLIRRLGRLIGRTVLTAAAIAVSVYATRRRPDPEESREASAHEPTEETEGPVVEAPEEEPITGEAPAEAEAEEPPYDEAEQSEETTDDVAKDESGGEEAPGEGQTDESVRELAAEDSEGEGGPTGGEAEELADEARPLDELTADELYPVAQRLDIVGRATMDQAQLVEALQAKGIHEIAQGEPVVEEAPVEDETEEPADEVADTGETTSTEEPAVEHSHEPIAVRPLDEMTADELYRLAQRLDIAGRSTMRKAQLVEALQAEGIDEAEG